MPPRTKKRDDYYRDRRRRKVCSFCADKTATIDYKEVNRLRRYLSERAKIEPRRRGGGHRSAPRPVIAGLVLLGGGAAAGAFGSLLGLGGGILIVPLLTLGFGLDLRAAVGVSLVCVIMTSSASAGVYLERHVANLRLGMTLELFTAIGALVGGSIAFLLDERFLSVLFAVLLLYVAVAMARARPSEQAAAADTEPLVSQPAA